jgi:hypothetical protein
MSNAPILRSTVTATALAAALGLSGCQHDVPTALHDAVAAKSANAGGGGGGGDKDPTVDSVFPDSALQDTTLDVEVSGSNFDDGSQVSFERDGVAAEKVKVNASTFINSKKLLANVTVQADADTGLYDVAVTTSKGRKGVGIEMFEVLERFEATVEDSETAGILSDGRGIYLEVALDTYFTLDARSGTSAREVCFDYRGQLSPDQVGFSDQPEGQLLCDDAHLTTSTNNFQEDNVTPGVALVDMEVGSVQRARLGGFYVRDGYNWSFRFGRDCDFIDLPEERASITRVSSTEWTIEATTMTLCKTATKGSPKNNGPVAIGLQMPVRLIVRLVRFTL